MPEQSSTDESATAEATPQEAADQQDHTLVTLSRAELEALRTKLATKYH